MCTYPGWRRFFGGKNVRDTGQVHMAYFYFDFRDTASHTLAYNIEPSEVVKIQMSKSRKGRKWSTHLCHNSGPVVFMRIVTSNDPCGYFAAIAQNIRHHQNLLRVETDQTDLVHKLEMTPEHDDKHFDLSLHFLDNLMSAVM